MYVDSPDKAKPFVRGGQKAAGLRRSKMAELPKDKPLVSSVILLNTCCIRYSYQRRKYEQARAEKYIYFNFDHNDADTKYFDFKCSSF